MKKIWAYIFSTLFGAGYFPFGSGTVGSLVALVFIFGATYVGGLWMVLGLAGLAYVVGIKAVRKVLKYVIHDSPIIVIDEFVGQAIAFLPLANLVTRENFQNFNFWMLCGASFLLFRFFDIVKLYPASYYEREVIDERGVMLDDVVAGIYSLIVLIVIMRFVKVA